MGESDLPSKNDNATGETTGTDGKQTLKPLFEALKENDNAMLSFAEGFRDKVKILFDHFDHDSDGRLKYDELAALQTATSGYDSDRLSKEMYVMACQSLNCHPDEGLSLEALKFTYAADGSDIDADYEKVFDKDGKPRKIVVKVQAPTKETGEESKDEKVYEIETNGVVDISSWEWIPNFIDWGFATLHENYLNEQIFRYAMISAQDYATFWWI